MARHDRPSFAEPFRRMAENAAAIKDRTEALADVVRGLVEGPVAARPDHQPRRRTGGSRRRQSPARLDRVPRPHPGNQHESRPQGAVRRLPAAGRGGPGRSGRGPVAARHAFRHRRPDPPTHDGRRHPGRGAGGGRWRSAAPAPPHPGGATPPRAGDRRVAPWAIASGAFAKAAGEGLLPFCPKIGSAMAGGATSSPRADEPWRPARPRPPLGGRRRRPGLGASLYNADPVAAETLAGSVELLSQTIGNSLIPLSVSLSSNIQKLDQFDPGAPDLDRVGHDRRPHRARLGERAGCSAGRPGGAASSRRGNSARRPSAASVRRRRPPGRRPVRPGAGRLGHGPDRAETLKTRGRASCRRRSPRASPRSSTTPIGAAYNFGMKKFGGGDDKKRHSKICSWRGRRWPRRGSPEVRDIE